MKEDFVTTVEYNKLRFYGHVHKMTLERPHKILFQLSLEDKCKIKRAGVTGKIYLRDNADK